MPEVMFLGSLALLYLPLLLSPGPNFLVLTQLAASESRLHGMAAACGVSSASILYSTLAVTGVGMLVSHTSMFQLVVRVGGGGYLLYKGFRTLRAAAGAAAQDNGAAPAGGLWQAYSHGLLTNLTNPQGLVFFSSVFASLLSPDLRAWAKPASIALIAACSLSMNFATVLLFSLSDVQRHYLRAKVWIDRVSGLLLGAFGVNLLKALWLR